MSEIEVRHWSAPDGVRYRVSVTERMFNDGLHLRRVRRIEFASLDGTQVGSTLAPGFFSLFLANSLEIENLWHRAVGR